MSSSSAPPAALPSDDRVGMTIGISVMMTALATFLVATRLYVRKFVSNALGADDMVAVATLVFTIITMALINTMTHFGLGRHTWNVDVQVNLSPYLQTFYLLILFYNVALGLLKLAILLQYYRIFSRKMQKVSLVVMVIVSLWSTGLVLVCIFTCHPISAFWDQSIHGQCIPNLPQWYINAAGNIATDLVIFALPIPVLWKLHLPKSQRLSLVAVFGLAFFTCTISLVRLAFLNLNADPFYDNVAAALWSLAELCCGLIASCLPSLRPILWRFVPGALRTGDARTGSHSGAYKRTFSGAKSALGSRVSHANGLKSSVTATSEERRNSSVEELTRNADNFEMVPRSPGKSEFDVSTSRGDAVGQRQQPKNKYGISTTVKAARSSTAPWDVEQAAAAVIKVKTDVVVLRSEDGHS